MLFNSLGFALFLPLVFILYWLLAKQKLLYQNGLLLAASYFFYSCWDWRFLFLLIFSTFLDYFTGLKMANATSNEVKKQWFWLSVIVNLGFLGVFKYYNFFATSFAELFRSIGIGIHPWTLKVILPVGISFYTFHGLSYVIDIYKNRIKAEKNFVDYAVFVSFFPLLVAGPIERATHLLPQIKQKRIFKLQQAKDGIYQIIWGLFKKVVIADSCAQYVNEIFGHYESMNSLSLLMGAVYFSFQIYGDFSGYSDIALGSAKLFGIDLLRNFNYPYFSRDIAEFWRRWHISLSSWFKDYLYIPLGGSQGGQWMRIRNTFVIFLVSGFWHGANWTFIVWGGINALLFMPLLISKTNRNYMTIVAQDKKFPSFKELILMNVTFCSVMISWIFFRADNLHIAWGYLKKMFSFDLSGKLQYLGIERYPVELLFLLIIFIVLEWLSRRAEHPFLGKWCFLRLIFILISILALGVYSDITSFIYFQF
ncbi:MAG: MBOAT family protein [Bacteroidetes bacterium]|nr:MBOAT family protein [Bacteroidota bacterium]